MLRKELLELLRSYKLLFVPVVFAIVGVGQPVGSKLLPQILKGATNLPAGTVIQIPMPQPIAVVQSILGQLGQIGVLLLVLVAMGAVAGECVSGVAATVLSKPIGRGAYVAAKAVALGGLAAAALLVALAFGAYYTVVLIGPIAWGPVLAGGACYLPDLLLPVGITLAFSAALPSPAAAGGAGLIATIALNVVPAYLGAFARSAGPAALQQHAAAVMAGALPVGLWRPLLFTTALVLASAVAAWAALRRREI